MRDKQICRNCTHFVTYTDYQTIGACQANPPATIPQTFTLKLFGQTILTLETRPTQVYPTVSTLDTCGHFEGKEQRG